ncbi:MAG: TM2 domain-containing protein [Gammaproteobacteria bacterium]|nr:TM2 domain-containing protein [Gammaproteobacteria bacterium]
MFSEKELNLEETELREQVSLLTPAQHEIYLQMEQSLLKHPGTYATLNWFFLLGLHHFYLRRWPRGIIDLLLSSIALYVLFTTDSPAYGGALLLAVAIIEVPQLLNYEHLVHSHNNQMMRRCLRRIPKSAPATPAAADKPER